MNNSYHSMFSEVIPNLSAAEVDWLEELSELAWETESDQPRIMEMLGIQTGGDRMDGWGGGMQWEIPDDKDTQNLWIACEEWFSMDHLVLFVQAFLRTHRPDAVFIVTWADWCDHPRISEFGGGAARITATDHEIKTTAAFRSEWESL
jgi:hypothetical protein